MGLWNSVTLTAEGATSAL